MARDTVEVDPKIAAMDRKNGNLERAQGARRTAVPEVDPRIGVAAHQSLEGIGTTAAVPLAATVPNPRLALRTKLRFIDCLNAVNSVEFASITCSPAR